MYIGAENIISPLGKSAQETFERMRAGESSIKSKDGILISTFSPAQNSLLPLMIASSIPLAAAFCISGIVIS